MNSYMPLKVVPMSASLPPNITLEQNPFMKCTTCSPRYYLLLKKRKGKESGSDSDIDLVEAQNDKETTRKKPKVSKDKEDPKKVVSTKKTLGLGKRKGRGGFIK